MHILSHLVHVLLNPQLNPQTLHPALDLPQLPPRALVGAVLQPDGPQREPHLRRFVRVWCDSGRDGWVERRGGRGRGREGAVPESAVRGVEPPGVERRVGGVVCRECVKPRTSVDARWSAASQNRARRTRDAPLTAAACPHPALIRLTPAPSSRSTRCGTMLCSVPAPSPSAPKPAE